MIIGHTSSSNEGKTANHFSTLEEFRQKLTALKSRKGGLPVILAVHSLNEPFNSDSEGLGGRGGWHVLVVSDFNAETGQVSIDNQWGVRSDRRMSIERLFKATIEPTMNQ